MLIRAGYSTADDLDVTKMCDEYMISYTPDIITRIPEFHDGPMVGEIKSVNTFQFKKMTHHPSAGKQLQWYMHLTGIHKGFVLNDDKNTQDFKLEVYDYDPMVVAPFIERAEQIMFYHDKAINERKMVSRPKDATAHDCKRCSKCALKDACWNVGIGRVKL